MAVNHSVFDVKKCSKDMYALLKKLYPLTRSITGNGVRKTLDIIKEHIPITINEFTTGTKVFDWNIPKEWNVRDAYIKDPHGNKVVDFKKLNLHVVNYSVPVHKKLPLEELKKHLHTLPEHPQWTPYITSYYKEYWGFCLPHDQYKQLKPGDYEVLVDSSLEKGKLSYGEIFLQGHSREEILFSCYICHPSLCNDSLSGVVLLTFMAKFLKETKLRYSYRFLFIPETIGAIAWLSRNEKQAFKIKYGLISTCVGDEGCFTYKKTRSGNAELDRVVERVLIDAKAPFKTMDFNPANGSDERQFSSPGFNLAVGSLMRTPYGNYPEYHTSADNLDFISGTHLAESLEKYLEIAFTLESNRVYRNLNPKCEPRLGKRGFYRNLSSSDISLKESAVFWILNLSDGSSSLLDISFRSGIHFRVIKEVSDALVIAGLLRLKK